MLGIVFVRQESLEPGKYGAPGSKDESWAYERGEANHEQHEPRGFVPLVSEALECAFEYPTHRFQCGMSSPKSTDRLFSWPSSVFPLRCFAGVVGRVSITSNHGERAY